MEALNHDMEFNILANIPESVNMLRRRTFEIWKKMTIYTNEVKLPKLPWYIMEEKI